jgi:hypothetical protein
VIILEDIIFYSKSGKTKAILHNPNTKEESEKYFGEIAVKICVSQMQKLMAEKNPPKIS